MKKSLFTFIAVLLVSSISLAHTDNKEQEKPQVGDTLLVSESVGEYYKHVNFPRLNTIVKRGGVATYKSVVNVPVVITKIMDSKDGASIVQIERADGKKFFNQTKYITASYEDAISSGELKLKS
ncbi:MAG: dihydroorotase [Winogradskyella sp.]|nr:dihydroorotase [Winogradskyella sp.]MBT8377164.1 dihydroorotase [Bacteroidia bacterium]NNC45032.1 dihydroorotase [Winogradskyella sp.]NNE13956.1 dihydroorotase [Saprospiraceae bacterium]NNK40663.1 dihydroorotase [Winogradskyella sp.]